MHFLILTILFVLTKPQKTFYSLINIPNVNVTKATLVHDAYFAVYQTASCMPKSSYAFKLYFPTKITMKPSLDDYNSLHNFVTTSKNSFITFTGQKDIWIDNIIPDLSAISVDSPFNKILYTPDLKGILDERLEVANFLLRSTYQNFNIKVLYILDRVYYEEFVDIGLDFDPMSSLGPIQGSRVKYVINSSADSLNDLIDMINDRAPTTFVVIASQETVKVVLDKVSKKNFLQPPYTWFVMSAGLSRTNFTYPSLSGSFFSVEFSLDNASKTVLTNAGFTSLNDEEVQFYDMVVLSRSYAQNRLCPNDFSYTTINLNSGSYKIDGEILEIIRKYTVFKGLGATATPLGTVTYLPNSISNRVTSDLRDSDLIPRFTNADLLKFLRQIKWRVAVINDPPFAYKDENGAIVGIIVDYLKYLLTSLGSNVEFIYVNSTIWKDTYSLIKTNEADMIGAPIIPIQVESNFHVSTPFMSTSFMMVYLDSDATPTKKLFRFTIPFTWETWLTLLFACIAVSITLYVIDRISPNTERISITSAFYFGFGAVFHAAGFTNPTRLSSRLLYICWFILSLIIIVCYGGAYAAYYTSLSITPSLKNPSQLLTQNKFKFGALADSNLLKILGNSIIPEQKKLFTLVNEVNLPLSDLNLILERINKSDFVFLSSSEMAIYLKNKYCYQISDKFYPAFYSFISNSNNLFNGLIDEQILKLTRENTITPILNKYIPNKSDSKQNCTSVQPNYSTESLLESSLTAYASSSIPIADLAGFYLIVIVGVSLSILILFVEGIVKLVKSRREKAKQGEDDADNS